MRTTAPVLLLALLAAPGRGQEPSLPVARDVWLGDSLPVLASSLTLSPTGETVACVTRDGVEVRDLATTAVDHRVSLRGARAAAFSSDGRLLAVANGRVIDALDTATWRVVRSWESEGASSIAFVSTERLVWSNEHRVTMGCARPRAPVERLEPQGGVTGLVASPTGTLLAGVDPRGRAVVWDVATGRRLLELGDCVLKVAFSPDGSRLVAVRHEPGRSPRQDPHGWWRPGSRVSPVVMWSVPSGEPLEPPPGLRDVHAFDVSFMSARELLVLTTVAEGTPLLRAHDLVSGAVTRRFGVRAGGRHLGDLLGVTASPEGAWVLGRSGEMIVWPRDGSDDVTATVGVSEVASIAFLSSETLAAADWRGVTVWDVPSRSIRWRTEAADPWVRPSSEMWLACSRDGRWVAFASSDGHHVQFAEVGTDRTVLLDMDGRDPVRALGAGTTDGTFVVGRMASIHEVAPDRPTLPIRELAVLSPAHGRLLSAAGVLLVLRRGARLRTFPPASSTVAIGGDERPIAAAITPDARTVVLGLQDGQVVLVDAMSGRRRWTAQVHDGPVRAVAVTGDGGLVLSLGGRTGSWILARDARDGAPIGKLAPPSGPWAVAPAGRRVALGDERLHVIDLAE